MIRNATLSESNRGVLVATVADRYAEDHQTRKAWLHYVLKVLGRCHYCRRHLTEGSIANHPAVCGRGECRRRARKEGFSHRALEPLKAKE
jgi:hypothetical protein